MREKPPIAFYNFLPLVSGGIEDTGRAREAGRGGGGGKSCQDRLFTQGLIENAVSHRPIRLGNLRGSFRDRTRGISLLRAVSQKFSLEEEAFFSRAACESNSLLFTRNFVLDF